MCSVGRSKCDIALSIPLQCNSILAILFIADNMVYLLGPYIGGSQHFQMVCLECSMTTTLQIIQLCTKIVMASVATLFILATNMFTEMRIISVFAMISSIFFILGAAVIMQYTLQQPSQWSTLPAYTNFTDTAIFVGMSMYAFEGQTMILPVGAKHHLWTPLKPELITGDYHY